jgi:hypothetical protein
MAFGKFEGEPPFTEYFWDLILGGCAGQEVTMDGQLYSYVTIDKEDRALYPTIAKNKYIVVWETEQGFVCHKFADYIPTEPLED